MTLDVISLRGMDVSQEKALDIHKKATVVDSCVMRCCIEEEKYFEEMREGGVDVVIGTIAGESENFLDAIKAFNHFSTIVENNGKMLHASNAADFSRAEREGKVAIVFAFQDAKPIEDNLSYLRVFHKLGIRVIQLTYNAQNLLGNGCCEFADGGLTYFGKEVIDEMNRMGIIVDLSHCGDQTTMDAIHHSKSPVVFTHAGVRSLCNTPRNKSDEQIKAMAETGGVIGISIFPSTLKLDQSKEGRPTLEDVLRQVDYIVKLVGVDYVGFGLDVNTKGVDEGWSSTTMRHWRKLRPDVYGYDKPLEVYPPFPLGLERHSDFSNVTKGLLARGYSEEETMKILGGNWMRVLTEVWEKAE